MFTPRQAVTVALALSGAANIAMARNQWATAAQYWRLNAIAARASDDPLTARYAELADTAVENCERKAELHGNHA